MPNNGTRIYCQVIDGKTYGVSAKADTYKVLGLDAYRGNYSTNYANQNTHNKINRFSAMKPYRFGSQLGITRDIAKANCFGMTPKLLFYGQAEGHELDSTPWGQWEPPTAAHWCRKGDFDGYLSTAKEHITALRIHTSKSDSHTTPILGTTGGDPGKRASIIGELETRGIDSGSIRLDECTYNGTMPIASWRLTLVLAAYVQGTVLEAAWVKQGPRADEMREGVYRIDMETTDNDAMLNGIEEMGYGRSVIILCLSPEITGATSRIVPEIPTHMLSLNMWGNQFQQIIYNEKYERPSTPKPENLIPIYGYNSHSGVLIDNGSMRFDNNDRMVFFNVDPTVTVDISEDSHRYNFNGVTGDLFAQFVISKVYSTDPDIIIKNVPVRTWQFVNYKTELYANYSVSYQDIMDRAGVSLSDGKYFVRCFFSMEMHVLIPSTKTDYYLLVTGNDEVDESMRDYGLADIADAYGGLFCFPGYSEQRQIYWKGI